jgi:Tfp pilus assembly protein PilV
MTHAPTITASQTGAAARMRSSGGFTYVEVLIAFALLAVAMLALCATSLNGYKNLSSAGRTTIGLSAARQLAEDVEVLPFANLANLNGFDTDNSATQPTSDPEREIARRWRYVLAGSGVGWTFTSTETARWTTMNLGQGSVGGHGTIVVVAKTAKLSEVRVSVSIPGRFKPVNLTTFVASMAP